jgi:hypothetical protein
MNAMQNENNHTRLYIQYIYNYIVVIRQMRKWQQQIITHIE